MPIDLYLNQHSPPCRAVLLVANQLNLDLNHKTLDMRNKEHKSPEFLEINPCHCIPTIVDNGFSLWESRAIIQYLCNKYAPDSELYPKEPEQRAKVDSALNFDMGSFLPAIRKGLLSKAHSGTEPKEEDVNGLKNTLKLLDTLIGDKGYVAATHLTIADLSLISNSSAFSFFEFDLSEYPNVERWYKKLNEDIPLLAEMNAKAKERMQERRANRANQ